MLTESQTNNFGASAPKNPLQSFDAMPPIKSVARIENDGEERVSIMDKEGIRIIGIFFLFGFSAFAKPCPHSFLLMLLTFMLIALIAVITKRSGFLIATPNPSKYEQMKIGLMYAVAIGMNWVLLIHLRDVFIMRKERIDRALCEFLLFDNIMLFVRLFLSFVKYTLSLWSLSSNSDFRIKFAFYSLFKNVCLILSFAVILINIIGIHYDL